MAAARHRVRDAGPADIPALIDLEDHCFASGAYAAHGFERAHFEYYLGNPNAVTLVLEVAGEVVGYVLGIVGTGARSEQARVHSVAVFEEHRGHGVGRKLMTRFVEEVASRGSRLLILEVAAENRPALAIFRKLGFDTVHYLGDYYGPGYDAERMQLAMSTISVQSPVARD